MTTTTVPVDVRCLNCGGDETLTLIGIVIGALALGAALTTLSVLLRPHGFVMRRLGARANLKLTAALENGTEPDLLESDASSVLVRVRIGIENRGDKPAENTTLQVLAPRPQSIFRWSDQQGRELPGQINHSSETLPLEGRGDVEVEYLTEEIPVVKLRTPAVRWVLLNLGTPSSGESRMPLRIKAQSDDLPAGRFDEVLDFEVRVRRPASP